jgi:hypothetical protein
VPVPYFLLFLCFRKITQEIFSELDKTKAEVSNYLIRRRSSKESRRWTRASHTLGWRPPLGRATRGCDCLVHPLTSPFRLYILLVEKTLGACNNPNFWEIEINRIIKIPNFGANTKFYFKYKISLLSF